MYRQGEENIDNKTIFPSIIGLPLHFYKGLYQCIFPLWQSSHPIHRKVAAEQSFNKPTNVRLNTTNQPTLNCHISGIFVTSVQSCASACFRFVHQIRSAMREPFLSAVRSGEQNVNCTLFSVRLGNIMYIIYLCI